MVERSAIPEKIGRYPVLRAIGRGAMGAVFLARDTELGRDVAIKTVRMPPVQSDRETFLVRFRNEARAVGRLRHPAIVAVYDVGQDPDAGPFLVFEYVEGANLKEVLAQKGPLSPFELVSLAEQVGSALDAAHREGIIHRDIKPENLLVGRDGGVHLADFGVARVPDAQLTTEGQFLGTPCYGAPETLMGREATRASDQFSFGAVLYEAVSGTRAFPGKEAVVVAHAVIHTEPKPPSRVAVEGAVVPPQLDAVIARAMHKDPVQRYGTLGALVLALRMAYADAGLLPRPDQPISRDPTGSVRRITAPELLVLPEAEAAPRGLPLWPFAAALLLGVVAVVQVGGYAGDLWGGGDRTTPPELPGDAAALTATQAEPDAAPLLLDAGLVTDAGADPDADAEVDAGDPAAAELAGLTTFEREERAKDALERAQKALASGDRDAARAAIEDAFRYDPENPDVMDLRQKL
jgi:predicted Ser/Thr protein kinase